MKKIFFLCFLFGLFIAESQNLDSLWKVFNNKNQTDTNRLKAIHAIAWSYNINDPDTAIVLANMQLKLAEKRHQKKYEARALNTIGVSYLNKSNFTKALSYHFKALDIRLSINDKQGIGFSYNNIGNVYKFQSNYTKALDYFLKSLKIKEELNDKKGIGNCLSNIGTVYFDLSNYSKALEYHFKSIKIMEEIGNLKGIGYCYNNIGICYGAQLDFKKALQFFLKAQAIWEEINDKDELGTIYTNIANIHFNNREFEKSLEYFNKSLKLRIEVGDEQGVGNCYNNISSVYNRLKSSALASKNAKLALDISKKIMDRDMERLAHENLAISFENTGNYKEAYENYIEFKKLTDTIFNKENSEQLSDLKVNFEVDKKEAELKIKSEAEQEKLKAIAIQEKKQQQIIIVAVVGVLFIVLIFSFFLYKRFKLTNKQKDIIEIKSKETETQKHLVEEKQKEIIDSITYAKRLQNAILPPTSFITTHLSNHFIYYQPKDIVAGDFYWAEKVDDLFFIAVADSTGHGVPGAMVSIVCSNALDKAVREFGLTDTGKILDKTTDLVLETFARSGEEIKDGMDISLLCVDKQNKKVFWSGAYNQLWYIRPNCSLTEIKADKQPIGKSDNRKLFTTHQIDYIEGTMFYLMTDGYADQFGGAKGKKFKYRQLEELIFNNSTLSLQQQSSVLHDVFTKWKENLEQVDDVTMVGIKI